MKRRTRTVIGVMTAAATPLLGAGVVQAQRAADFAEPVKITAGDEPINVDVGHAAPFVYDFDGDGARDLLVGQFGNGALRIYRNTGTNEQPQFGEFQWFEAGGARATVPYG